jgi:hypothetical protein
MLSRPISGRFGPRRAAATPSSWPSRVLIAQVVNPISAFRSKAVKEVDVEEDDFSVPGLEPLLSERPLYTDATAGGIALYFAPRPFNLRRGRTRRAFDVPLVNAWFKERCPADHPVKVLLAVSCAVFVNRLRETRPRSEAAQIRTGDHPRHREMDTS